MTRIAIIEDEASIAEMYEFKLKAAGYEVRHALDGTSGYKLVASYRPHLILLDLMMPGISGPDVLKKIRAEDWGKEMKVIILTNINAEQAPDELNSLEISRYIIKAQTTPKEILEMVEEVLR